MHQILLQGIPDLREMALVVLVDELLRFIEHDQFDGRRTDVDPHIIKWFHFYTTYGTATRKSGGTIQ